MNRELATAETGMANTRLELTSTDFVSGRIDGVAAPGTLTHVSVSCDGAYWATVPVFPAADGPETSREFSCQLPPVSAPRRVEIEVRDAVNDALVGNVVVRQQPRRNKDGLLATDVYSLRHSPLHSMEWIETFNGARLVLTGAHLPPDGDPSKLGVEFPPGVTYFFEYPLPSPYFGEHYWYWPNGHLSALRLTIDLVASTPKSDPFQFRFVYPGSVAQAQSAPPALDSGIPYRGNVWIPKSFESFIGFPNDRNQLTRVQTYSHPQSVTMTGYNAFRMMESLLLHHGIRPAKGVTILDWGCGHGRVTRHFIQNWPEARVCGTDIDAENIAWCRRNLDAKSFSVAPLWPPLSYREGSFDAVFAISVMTHLTAEAQEAWLAELVRILKPGGLALLTFSGLAATAYSTIWHDPAWWSRWRESGFDDEQNDASLDGKIKDAT